MTNQLLARFELLNQLSSVARYSRDHVHRRESVLEHIGFCALYAYILHGALPANVRVVVDRHDLLVAAIAHDLDEAFTGDIPRTTKYAQTSLTKAIKDVEEISVLALIAKIDGIKFNDWHDAKDKSVKGQLMKLIDFAAVVYKAWTEIKLFGNFSFQRVLNELGLALNAMDLKKYHPFVAEEFYNLKQLVQRMIDKDSPAMRFDLFGEEK